MMGSPPSEPQRRPDENQVQVTFRRGFWMAETEVTQGQWTSVVGSLPREMDKGAGNDYPVYWVSYLDAEHFCRGLTERAHAAGELPGDWNFLVPTEAQWEYACRAGTRTATSFGESLSHSQANFQGEPYNGGEGGPAPGQASKAGAYPANPWGIFDMHGNIFEWCRDWYHSQLPGGIDPDLSTQRGVRNRDGTYSRVRRGGAWIETGSFCRSATRLRYEPERTSDHIGFRVVGQQTTS